jgi:hypothetical protein
MLDKAPVVVVLAVIPAKNSAQKRAVAYPNTCTAHNAEGQDRIDPSWDSDGQHRRRNGAQDFVISAPVSAHRRVAHKATTHDLSE